MISNYKKSSFKSISLGVALFTAISIVGLTNSQQISVIASNSNTKTVQKIVNVKIIPAEYTEKNVKINYPQVSNLTDKNKQKIINQTIKNDVLKQLNMYKSYGEGITADINYSIKLNNGKLLSISYSGYTNFKNAAHPSNIFFTTNININNETKVKLSDLVNINKAFVKKVRVAKYIGPLNLTKEVSDGVKTTLSWYTDADLTRMLKSADAVKGESFSYLTKDSLVVSLPMIHVIGDYGEFAVKYSNITNDIRTKNIVWKDLASLSK